MSVFTAKPIADAGDFAGGDHAALAYDILRMVANHESWNYNEIDLSVCPHLKPYSITCLAAIGEKRKRAGNPIDLVLPKDTECAAHLTRLGLTDYFRLKSELPEPVAVRQTNLPINCVAWPPRDAASRIVEMLAPQAQLAAGVSPKLKEHLSEVIDNALVHAESPVDCLVGGQSFPKAQKVEIAVVDLGQTILGHLKCNPEHSAVSSDADAIEHATVAGITGTPAGSTNAKGFPNSGIGLFELRKYCESGGGELTILSGSAWRTYSPDNEGPITGALYRPFRGTIVNIRFFVGIDLPDEVEEPII